MTSKQELLSSLEAAQDKINEMEQDKALLRIDLCMFEDRVQEELAKHTPIIPEIFWREKVTNNSTGFICSEEDCGFYWPCPTWKAIRRVAGLSDQFEELRIALKEE